jgi:hypothetical protein
MAFDARSMSNLAYAYTLVGYDPKLDNSNSLLLKVGDRSMTCIKQFKPQELANLMWSFAKTDVQHVTLFVRSGTETPTRLSVVSPVRTLYEE